MNQRRPLPLFVRCLPLLSLALLGCGRTPPLAQLPPPVVTVSQPVQETTTDYAEFSGKIEPVETVDVRARVRGYLVKVNFTDGTVVKKGDLLFEIDPRPYKATLDQAEANLHSAEASRKLADAEFARIRSLANKNAASREELDVITGKRAVSVADVEKAKAAVEQARLDLDFTKINSPIDGRISNTKVTVGNLISGGETVLTTIVTQSQVYVYFNVDERAVQRYVEENRKKGIKDPKDIKEAKIPVWMGLAGDEGKFPYEGLIDFVDNRVDPGTGTVRVRGVFDNKDFALLPGYFTRVRVEGPGEAYAALLVSERAVGTDQGQKFVYVVNAEDKVEYRAVRLGTLHDGRRVIEEGLKPGEWVIVNGLQRVRPGIPVKPERVPMPGGPVQTKSEK